MAPLLPVQSSMFSHAGYDPATRTLAVRFKDSNFIHPHLDVPPELARTVLGAGSIGKAFNEHIKGKYPIGELVEVDSDDAKQEPANAET